MGDYFAWVHLLLAHSDNWFSKLARGSFLLDEHDENGSKSRCKSTLKTNGLLDNTEWQVRPLQTVQAKFF